MAFPGAESAARELSQLAKERATDLDETRRLLYMALVTTKTGHHDLAGTLINALRHHHGVDDPGLEARVVALIEEGGPALESWAAGQIENLTDQLENR